MIFFKGVDQIKLNDFLGFSLSSLVEDPSQILDTKVARGCCQSFPGKQGAPQSGTLL